jgi:hypothetical protein
MKSRDGNHPASRLYLRLILAQLQMKSNAVRAIAAAFQAVLMKSLVAFRQPLYLSVASGFRPPTGIIIAELGRFGSSCVIFILCREW